MRIIDRTNQALGRNIARTRGQNTIRRIGIHHSATATGTTAIFENFWRTIPNAMGGVGGYHEVILLNGDVEINYPPTRVSHGVSGQNGDTYNICIVGNFTQNPPSGVQLQVLLERIRFNVNRFANVTFDRVLGHIEFPGQSTECPGRATNMNNIRAQASQVRNTHTVRAGETLSGIARQYRTTVADLQRLNGIANTNMIRVGQVLRLPNSTISTGSRVQLTNAPLFTNATTATQARRISGVYFIWSGQATNSRLRITNQANRVGVAGQVTGWVRLSDVRLI